MIVNCGKLADNVIRSPQRQQDLIALPRPHGDLDPSRAQQYDVRSGVTLMDKGVSNRVPTLNSERKKPINLSHRYKI